MCVCVCARAGIRIPQISLAQLCEDMDTKLATLRMITNMILSLYEYVILS